MLARDELVAWRAFLRLEPDVVASEGGFVGAVLMILARGVVDGDAMQPAAVVHDITTRAGRVAYVGELVAAIDVALEAAS
jgi:hypothetical protein